MIAFTEKTNTIYGVSGLVKILSVFRVYGPPIKGNVFSPILPVNNLQLNL